MVHKNEDTPDSKHTLSELQNNSLNFVKEDMVNVMLNTSVYCVDKCAVFCLSKLVVLSV